MQDPSWNISIQGEIDASAPGKVEAALKKAGANGADVYIDSPGGSLAAAMMIGRMLRSYEARSIVGRYNLDRTKSLMGQPESTYSPAGCFSSCTLAFLGGVYRYTISGSQFGVHRFSSRAGPSADDMDLAQMVSATIISYIREMGASPALFDKWVQEGKDSIRLLTKAELDELSVVNNGRLRPVGLIEAVEGGQILKGSQQTRFGEGKAIFVCADRGILFYSFYEMDKARSDEILGGNWLHSLMIDDNATPLPKPAAEGYRSKTYSALFPLTRDQAWATGASDKIGHAMQQARAAPTFIGYSIDLPKDAKSNVQKYIENCLSETRKK